MADFYASPRGTVARNLVRERLRRCWPALDGLAVLGLGYASPYLEDWAMQASRCCAAVTSQAGAAPAYVDRWPDIANATCATEDHALPFPDLTFDRILLVHGLEAADNARALLREVWRILKDDGRIIVIAPNRVGMWAHVESTPFGHGQPYSHGQLGRLLSGNLFRIERRDTALYVPPVELRVVLRTANAWEVGGRWLAPHLAGVTITEAIKDAYAITPARKGLRRFVLSKAA